MKTIRLIRSVAEPGNRGPSRGMFALQSALRDAAWPWLQIGGQLRPGEIPWVWNFQDKSMIVTINEWGWPFIIGPNVLFANSYHPGEARLEQEVLDAEHCVLQFTESDWYAALIRQHCDRNDAPVAIWSYPIDPQPKGPLRNEFDVMVYLKDMTKGREMVRIRERWPNSNLVVYGHYKRDTMIDIARRSRACVYASADDRGPLAAAEIALAGCPLVGVERGCPWTNNNMLGVQIPHFGKEELIPAVERALEMDREMVRCAATAFFATSRTVQTIHDALEPIAMERTACAG